MQRFVASSEESIFGLVRDLRQETVDLIRQEFRLARAEVSEKLACFTRNAAGLVIGGFVAYAGVIALLVGLGFLLAMGFVALGMDPAMAEFAGLGIIGIVIALIGISLVTKAVKALSHASLTPERTVETLRELAGESTLAKAQLGPHDNRSSKQIQEHIETTRTHMQATASELGHRLTPRYAGEQVVTQAKAHPGITAAVGFGTGLLSLLLVRRRRHNRACALDGDGTVLVVER